MHKTDLPYVECGGFGHRFGFQGYSADHESFRMENSKVKKGVLPKVCCFEH